MHRLLRSETLAAIFVFLAAAGLLIPTAELRAASASLPATMLISLMVLATILLVLDQRRAAVGEAPQTVTNHPTRVLSAFTMVILYVVSVQVIGFYISTAIAIPTVAYAFGYRNPVRLAVATVIVLAAIYAIFDYAMSQEFPVGLLWEE